jgi:hypothetical protein
MVVWYDAEGRRQRRSRATLKEADELVRDVSEALQKKVNGAITLDDRQAYSLARELVEPFRYTVLQAVREWERSKAPYRGKKTADVIVEFIAAKHGETPLLGSENFRGGFALVPNRLAPAERGACEEPISPLGRRGRVIGSSQRWLSSGYGFSSAACSLRN